MSWDVRHEGSPKSIPGLTLAQVIEGLRDGRWVGTDEVKGPADRQWRAIENHPQLAEVAAEVEAPAPVHDDETHLDMNALIDVTMVLLIFFILTTTHAAAIQKVVPVPTVSVDPKSGKRVVHADQVKKYMIRVLAKLDDKGRPIVHVEGQAVDVIRPADGSLDGEKLTGLLRTHVQGEPPRIEVVLDARKVSWGLVIAIQDAARAAGVRNVHHVHQREAAAKAG